MTPPTLHGPHPPGVVTPHLTHGQIGAFDNANLAEWAQLAERLMRAGGITVTIGLGASFFSPRERPAGLSDLPAFAGDDLQPERCGGAACVLICSNEPSPDTLTRFGTPRWQRSGQRTANGALGFRDGTMNPRRPLDLDQHVWVKSRDRSWMVGGTYLVVRDIHVDDTWHRLDKDAQERTIGRDKVSGAPLGGKRLFEKPELSRLPQDAHIVQAAPRTSGVTILRRGYDTDDGLLFLAFMRDPRRQFVPLQHRLSEHDALHPHTTAKGSAVFAIPPGPVYPLLYAQ
jgi:deferrochelatase/peroxidase EfeB